MHQAHFGKFTLGPSVFHYTMKNKKVEFNLSLYQNCPIFAMKNEFKVFLMLTVAETLEVKILFNM